MNMVCDVVCSAMLVGVSILMVKKAYINMFNFICMGIFMIKISFIPHQYQIWYSKKDNSEFILHCQKHV